MTSDRDRTILQAIGERGADLGDLHERVEGFETVELERLLERDMVERRTIPPLEIRSRSTKNLMWFST